MIDTLLNMRQKERGRFQGKEEGDPSNGVKGALILLLLLLLLLVGASKFTPVCKGVVGGGSSRRDGSQEKRYQLKGFLIDGSETHAAAITSKRLYRLKSMSLLWHDLDCQLSNV